MFLNLLFFVEFSRTSEDCLVADISVVPSGVLLGYYIAVRVLCWDNFCGLGLILRFSGNSEVTRETHGSK